MTFETIITVEDRNRLVSDLEIVRDNLYSQDPEVLNRLSYQSNEILKNIIGEFDDKSAVGHKIDELKDNLMALPIARFKFAFIPDDAFLKKVKELLTRQTSKDFLLAISVDPDLIAGLQLEIGGKFFDLSLGSKLDKFLDSYDHRRIQ